MTELVMVENPYLVSFLRVAGDQVYDWDERADHIEKFGWAVPNADAIQALVARSPVVEIGAGNGYWKMLIEEAGGDVIAYDSDPPSPQKSWSAVRSGHAGHAARHPGRTLFLCWPPYGTTMARDALQGYLRAGGSTVIYVGEGECGCTGDDAFHQMLNREMNLEEEIVIPQWCCIHDRMFIYKRLRYADN